MVKLQQLADLAHTNNDVTFDIALRNGARVSVVIDLGDVVDIAHAASINKTGRAQRGPIRAKVLTPAKRINPAAVVEFEVGGGGTVYTFLPKTDAARVWLQEHVDTETAQWLGGALVVEHRYIADIVRAAQAEGFVVR